MLSALGSAGALRAAASRRLNVLLIVSDDLNCALGTYGHPAVKTPHLDRLARRGVVFERSYCQFPLCQPSRTSFLSGLRAETTKVWTLETPTRQHVGDAVFLPELFRKHGYFTAHAGKIFHTGEECEDPRSWDVEVREKGKNPPAGEILAEGKAKGPKGHSFVWDSLKTEPAAMPDGKVALQAVEWLEQSTRDGRPFFIGAGFRRPHAPYAAPKMFFDMYPPEQTALPDTSPEEYRRVLPAAVNHDPPDVPLPEIEVRRYRAAYYASVTFMDSRLGVLLDAMDRLKLWDNTVVVFCGDNGYHLGEHGGLWHKNSLFEEGARVPLVVAAPGRRGAGKRSGRLVELVDIYPTLAGLCGLPAPASLEGTSLAPLLDDPALPWKKGAFSMQGRGKERTEAAKDIQFIGRSVRTERWRYTEWDEGKQGVEMYDHQTDPREVVNLASDANHARTRVELQALLRGGWRAARP
jgi:iduronate 2-sulfatase